MHRNRFRYYENIFICRPQTSINNEIISHNLLRNRPCQKEHRFVVISCIPISNHLCVFNFGQKRKQQQANNQPTNQRHIQYTRKELSHGLLNIVYFSSIVFRRNDETCTQVLGICLYWMLERHRRPIFIQFDDVLFIKLTFALNKKKCLVNKSMREYTV